MMKSITSKKKSVSLSKRQKKKDFQHDVFNNADLNIYETFQQMVR